MKQNKTTDLFYYSRITSFPGRPPSWGAGGRVVSTEYPVYRRLLFTLIPYITVYNCVSGDDFFLSFA